MKQVAEYIIPIIQDGKNTVPDFLQAKELIRCKDCKHHRGENACEKDGCYGWYDTDYCSRAERKETS